MKNLSIAKINQEIESQMDQETAKMLLATTFKGLSLPSMKQAVLEGMMRGFTFQNFLEKDVYAVPFSGGYSLITSIDYARKIASENGMSGKDAPIYGEDGSCSVTVYRMVEGQRCPFTATVFQNEYSTGKNQWAQRPKTMIAKVAEMHALRQAFPKELSKAYSEEEMSKSEAIKATDYNAISEKFAKCETEEDLKLAYLSLSKDEKNDKEVIAMASARKMEIVDGVRYVEVTE